jgi:hypothetical protein
MEMVYSTNDGWLDLLRNNDWVFIPALEHWINFFYRRTVVLLGYVNQFTSVFNDIAGIIHRS